MTQAQSELLHALDERGLRITSARRDVARAIEVRSGGFTAEEICDDVPQVGRATVYRAIRTFQDSGVICKLALPDGAPRYAVDAGGRHHHHSICTSCGRVDDFRHSTVERVLNAISTDVSGDITGHRIEIYVTCTACQQKDR